MSSESSRDSSTTDAEWKRLLTPEQYRICRAQGTERPFSSPLNSVKTPGTFRCIACRQGLFSSADKFDSGSGWPSFVAPMSERAVAERKDHALGMTRTEVTCSNCGAHLGHVFDDGPRDRTGLRYCINGVALEFESEERS